MARSLIRLGKDGEAGVADLSGPLAWANEQNCQTTFGKFFCPIIKERQRLAVIHETTMRTASFDPLFVGQGPVTFASLGADLRGLVNLHINTAAEQSKRVLSSFGGSSVVTTEAGMVLLLMLVSG